MDKTNLLITGGIIGVIIVLLSIWTVLYPNSASTNNSISTGNLHDINSTPENIINDFYSTSEDLAVEDFPEDPAEEYLSFDNSTPKSGAISIARLNQGVSGFYNEGPVNATLTSDGKYWIVNMEGTTVTVDAKTLMSKSNVYTIPPQTWSSLDELKAYYIAEIQSSGEITGKYSKITIDGKEIWKIPVYVELLDQPEIDHGALLGYVYVDVATGKSKNTWKEFNKAAGTNNWLTLKEADYISFKMFIGSPSSEDALRNLYPQ